MHPEITPKRVFTAAGVLAALLLFSYLYFQSYDLIRGPFIEVYEPADGATLTEQPVTLSGQAKNVSLLLLNDHPLPTSEDGFFEEQLLLSHGYTIITLYAEDRFGRTITKTLNLVHE